MNCARILLLLTTLVTAPALASTESEYRFRVLLGNSEIGQHIFRIERNGSDLRVESKADFSVRLLVIEAYRYHHRANERWAGNCLEKIEARTNDNGKRIEVRGSKQQRGFVVEGNDGLPSCVMTFAYWNPAILDQPQLLNSQTGELVAVQVEPLGEEVISVRGVATPARRYALRAPQFRVDVWYARDNRWVQLESTTESGKPLRYLIQ